MKRFLISLLGSLLVAAAVIGLVASVYGIVQVWRVRQPVQESIESTLNLLDDTLSITAEALSVSSQSLDQVGGSLDTLVTTIRGTGKSVHDTLPLIDLFGQVTRQDLPQTLHSTQGALSSAQASAGLIDKTLAFISSIPLLNIVSYDANQPLSGALKDVSSSLDAIPKTLAGMNESIQKTGTNLAGIETQLDRIAADIGGIRSSVTSAQKVISRYRQQVSTLQQRLAQLRRSLTAALDGLAWFCTLVLAWLAVTQLGLLAQGLQLLGVKLAPPERVDPKQSN